MGLVRCGKRLTSGMAHGGGSLAIWYLYFSQLRDFARLPLSYPNHHYPCYIYFLYHFHYYESTPPDKYYTTIMLFSRSLFVAVISAPFLVFAQNGDGLALTTTSSFQITAGEPVTITWDGSAEGTITLVLRSGDASNLSTGTIIAC